MKETATKRITATAHIDSAIKRKTCIRVLPENACNAHTNMICYRQSRNILLNRIGHGAFDYSLRFSHFYGDAILNYLLEFFFA